MQTETIAPAQVSYEELLKTREELMAKKEELEAALSVISDELLFRLTEEKISGKIVGNYSITKATRVSFDVSLETAQALGATKEVIDQAVLKKQLAAGVDVPGMKKTEYIMVREVVKGGE